MVAEAAAAAEAAVEWLWRSELLLLGRVLSRRAARGPAPAAPSDSRAVLSDGSSCRPPSDLQAAPASSLCRFSETESRVYSWHLCAARVGARMGMWRAAVQA